MSRSFSTRTYGPRPGRDGTDAASSSSEDAPSSDEEDGDECEQPPHRYDSSFEVQPLPSKRWTFPARTPLAVGPAGRAGVDARREEGERRFKASQGAHENESTRRTLLSTHDEDVVRVTLGQREPRQALLLVWQRHREHATLRAATAVPPFARHAVLRELGQVAEELAQVARGSGERVVHVERDEADLEVGALVRQGLGWLDRRGLGGQRRLGAGGSQGGEDGGGSRRCCRGGSRALAVMLVRVDERVEALE